MILREYSCWVFVNFLIIRRGSCIIYFATEIIRLMITVEQIMKIRLKDNLAQRKNPTQNFTGN